MGVIQFDNQTLLVFFLVLIRVSAFYVTWPVFGTTQIPNLIKIALALVTAVVLYPLVLNDTQVAFTWDSLNLVYHSVREVFVGLCLGYICRLFFFIVSIAGNLISLSMGLSQAQLYNPALGEQGNAMEQFYVILGTLFFLAVNGHHFLLMGLTKSFTLVPLLGSFVSGELLASFAQTAQDILVMGIQMAAPAIITIFFVNVAMGVIGRTVPQINVLITTLPLNVLVGLLILIVSLPLLVSQFSDLAEVMARSMFSFMKEF